MTLDKLIVMDDVSGLASKSDVFSNFLQCLENMDYLCINFSYYLPKLTKLGEDNVTISYI